MTGIMQVILSMKNSKLFDYSPILPTNPLAFSFVAMPKGPQSAINLINSYGVNKDSLNDGTSQWNNSFSGTIPYYLSPITTNNYFTQGAGLQIIKGDGSSDGLDWNIFWWNGGIGDFDGSATSPGSAYFGSENTTNGGSNGNTVTRGRVWGFSPSIGWTLLYVLDLPGNGTYNHYNGYWFNTGNTVTGDPTVLGKRAAWDNLIITHLGFTVGTV